MTKEIQVYSLCSQLYSAFHIFLVGVFSVVHFFFSTHVFLVFLFNFFQVGSIVKIFKLAL